MAEDEDILRRVIVLDLVQNGYRVLEARTGLGALELALHQAPTLAILDLEMPGMGGLEVIGRLRKAGNSLPVLVLSGRGSVGERVQGLDAGADDYLAKPFESDELLARVRALLRRHEPRAPAGARFHLGDVAVDLTRKVVVVGGATVALSGIECSVLALLHQNAGRPVGRKEMLSVVWGYTYVPSTRTVDTHIWRLRKKLGDSGSEPRWIRSVPGVGYVLELGRPGT